jgi:N-acetylglucosaminyl-diphospho-decaprenol L-rhamnosyltransferase
MPGAAPLLDIVIVSYRSREPLRRLLASLQANPPRAGTACVHVVDNASGDGTVAAVREAGPAIDLREMPANVGFAAANNVVLRESAGRFVLLLNPDTEVTPGALDRMLEVMESRAGVGMAGCRLVRPDGSFDHAAKRGFPTPLSALAHFSGIGRGARAGAWLAQYRAPDLGERESGEVEAINGAFMLVRREALRDVGLLDEGYWLYMEDLDWCYRFHQRGWKVWYEGGVDVVHLKGASAGAHRDLRRNVAFHRGMARFYRKFYAGRRPLTDAAVYAGIAAKLAVSALRSAVVRRSLP